MNTPVLVSTEPGVFDGLPTGPNPVKDAKPRSGVVSRLLAQVSRMNGEYVDYQMEAGVWRKLAL